MLYQLSYLGTEGRTVSRTTGKSYHPRQRQQKRDDRHDYCS